MKTELYTRAGCHLCEEAHQMLTKYNVEPALIDIDSRPELLGKYSDCVPVVVINDKVRFRGRVDERLLKRILAAGAA